MLVFAFYFMQSSLQHRVCDGPLDSAAASNAPVLVPATQSKYLNISLPISASIASNIYKKKKAKL